MESFVIWLLVFLLTVVIVVPYFIRFVRRDRAERDRRAEAVALGFDQPVTQHPIIDELSCIGCGTCVEACPEGDVLGVVHGTAKLINGLRCVGHARCEEVCPVNALTVGLGDVAGREDIPVLDEYNQSNVPGLYFAGELSGVALIRNAVRQGARAVERIASGARAATCPGIEDLVVVGAGPAGLASALSAQQHGLSCVVLDQQDAGGTILQYPRRKLVLTQPVEIPLFGTLDRPEYRKEELLEIWSRIPEKFDLSVHTGDRVLTVEQRDGSFAVTTQECTYRAKNVVLAMGRRGTPRKLGVPGEDQSKVMYRLTDAESYRDCHILIVGGGDSAVEAAMGLARQPGTTVTLSYRRTALVRIKKRNADRIDPLLTNGTIRSMFSSEVLEIDERFVRLRVGEEEVRIENDYTFVFAGGDPPFKLLRDAGVAFGGDLPVQQRGIA